MTMAQSQCVKLVWLKASWTAEVIASSVDYSGQMG